MLGLIKKEKEGEGCFFNPSQPLTSNIFKSLNLEFMNIILRGLRLISEKQNEKLQQRLKKSEPELNKINKEDFSALGVCHPMWYDNNLDNTNEMNIHISSKKSSNRIALPFMPYRSNTVGTRNTKTSDNMNIDDRDAEINEFCPLVFENIRLMDGVSPDILIE